LNGERETSRTDFCIVDPSTTRQASPAAPRVVWGKNKQLKVYWESGYFWQNEDFEREWCIMRNYDGNPGTGVCYDEQEIVPCDPKQTYIAKCGKAEAKQQFDIGLVNGDVDTFMIRVSNSDNCLQLDNRNIVLHECDASSNLQHWNTINGGFDGNRFEIVPSTLPTHCVTQDHQPKAGELVRIYRCELPRRPDTLSSFWEFFD